MGKEDTILYAAAFDANGGFFEPLFNNQDAIISDQLNHASLIDGIRLCKAQRFRYLHNNMLDLEKKLIESQNCRNRIIVTDAVFSMDGTIAQMDKICHLAKKYDALVMSDECHSTGFIGPSGRGVHEEFGVMDDVDIITGTLGKALGGLLVDLPVVLKKSSKFYVKNLDLTFFSNTLAPSIVGACLAVMEIIESDNSHLNRLKKIQKNLEKEFKKLDLI